MLNVKSKFALFFDFLQCKWVPRRDENNPKTLDQIHKEAQKEEQERQIFLQQANAQQKAQGRGGGARGNIICCKQ